MSNATLFCIQPGWCFSLDFADCDATQDTFKALFTTSFYASCAVLVYSFLTPLALVWGKGLLNPARFPGAFIRYLHRFNSPSS